MASSEVSETIASRSSTPTWPPSPAQSARRSSSVRKPHRPWARGARPAAGRPPDPGRSRALARQRPAAWAARAPWAGRMPARLPRPSPPPSQAPPAALPCATSATVVSGGYLRDCLRGSLQVRLAPTIDPVHEQVAARCDQRDRCERGDQGVDIRRAPYRHPPRRAPARQDPPPARRAPAGGLGCARSSPRRSQRSDRPASSLARASERV